MGRCNFRAIQPINVPEIFGKKINFFNKKRWIKAEVFYMEPIIYISITETMETINTLIQDIQGRHDRTEKVIKVKVSRGTEKQNYAFQMKHLVLQYLVWSWNTFLEKKLEFSSLWCWDKKDVNYLNLLTRLAVYIEWNYVGNSETPLLHCFF